MSELPPGFNISHLAGPQIIGQYLDWGLMGVLSMQVYLYHTLFPEDRWSLRAFVYGVFVFEWVQTGLITAFGFSVWVSNFGDVENMLQFHNTWFSVPVMTAIIAMATQVFYAHRIWILSRSKFLGGIIVVLALTQCSMGFVTGIELLRVKSAVDATSLKSPTAWLSISASVDIIIAVAMTILLLRMKTGFSYSDMIINNLVRLMIESGTVTAGVAIVEVVLVTASRDTLYYQCPALVLAKLYANTIMASLNNRAFIQRSGTSVAITSARSGPTCQFSFGRTREAYNSGVAGEDRTETIIHVDVLKETEVDSTTNDNMGYPMRSYPPKCHTIDEIV